MANQAIPYKWSPDGTFSTYFEIQTALTDFDEPLVPKNVYFCDINLAQGSSGYSSIKVSYREHTSSDWTLWGNAATFNNSTNTLRIELQNNVSVEPIKNIVTFQLKIEVNAHKTFAINDINIIFRPKRKWTATDVKTYIRAT